MDGARRSGDARSSLRRPGQAIWPTEAPPQRIRRVGGGAAVRSARSKRAVTSGRPVERRRRRVAGHSAMVAAYISEVTHRAVRRRLVGRNMAVGRRSVRDVDGARPPTILTTTTSRPSTARFCSGESPALADPAGSVPPGAPPPKASSSSADLELPLSAAVQGLGGDLRWLAARRGARGAVRRGRRAMLRPHAGARERPRARTPPSFWSTHGRRPATEERPTYSTRRSSLLVALLKRAPERSIAFDDVREARERAGPASAAERRSQGAAGDAYSMSFHDLRGIRERARGGSQRGRALWHFWRMRILRTGCRGV